MGRVSRSAGALTLAASLLAASGSPAPDGGASAGAAHDRPRRVAPAALDLFSLRPGMARGELDDALRAVGWRATRWGRQGLLLERPVLPGLFAEQRALLELDLGGALRGVTVHLLPARDDRGEALLELYAETRALLLRRLGRPAWAREEGTARDLVAARGAPVGEWLRCLQWEGAFVTRLGIPRTPGGEPRVEIRLASEELPPADAYWGRDL
jgi:hypothetical protein